MIYLLLFLVVLSGIAVWRNPHYLQKVMYDIKNILGGVFRFVRFMCEWLKTIYERQQTYCINQNMSPYLEVIRRMNLCKYFQFISCEPLNGDITIFNFEIMGIHPEYRENMDVLKNILTATLRDFYIMRLGVRDAPPVFLSYVQEGELAFWVANNLHGARLLADRLVSDTQIERPTENIVLTDEYTTSKYVLLGFDLDMYEVYHQRKKVELNIEKLVHGLVIGASGSGKSFFGLFFLRNLLHKYNSEDGGNNVILYVCDFKMSKETDFLSGYKYYYAGEECEKGLIEFYEEYRSVKNGKYDGRKIRLLWFDEWGGYMLWKSHMNKKQSDMQKEMLQEILMLGRSLKCCVWIGIQRPDSQYVPARENFMSTICFCSAGLSPELKRMAGIDDELGRKIKEHGYYNCGEAIVLKDGEKPAFLKVPSLDIGRIQNEILDALACADGEAGSTDKSQPHSSIT